MNSVLCRLALGGATIDALSFSTVRLASGALMLLLVTRVFEGKAISSTSNWASAVLLFLYAVAFSLAYIRLSAGTGALILFGSVQATMILAALWKGERPRALEWVGLFIALAGLVYLVFPGLTAPPLLSSCLMAVAGISWGIYSLRGRGVKSPLIETTENFVRALPLAILLNLFMLGNAHLSIKGVLLAALSGSVTSGMGYVVWYKALKSLTAMLSATVQLVVPVLAALGGLIILAEGISMHLILSAVVILGGVGLALLGRKPAARSVPAEVPVE